VLSFAGDVSGTSYTLADQTLDGSTLYDPGYGLLQSATDVSNDTVTEVGYDGLGRITYMRPARVDDSMVPAPSPTHRFSYELVPGGLPVSVVYAYQENSATIGAATIESRSYVDGLGRARASLVKSAANQWEQSGIVEFTARGSTLRSWQPHFITTAAPSPRHAVARPSWLTHTGEIGCNTSALYDPFDRQTAATDCDASTITSYRALSVEVYDAHDMNATHPFYNTPAITRYDGHGRAIEQMLQNRRYVSGSTWGSVEFYRLRSTYRPDGAVTEIRRAKVNSVAYNATVDSGNEVIRTFTYDTAGRRIASTDPDTDNAGAAVGARTWRYLFNPVGDLAAVRDPRGCGQNFFYDRAGRLIGEDYIGCATESQVQGDTPDEDIPAGSVGLGDVASPTAVDARYFFDGDPPWESAFGATVPARPVTTQAAGRLTGTSNRAERSVVSYDERGRVTWTGRQIALIPDYTFSATTLADPPSVVTGESITPSTRVFDETHTYAIANAYDHGNRPLEMTFPEDPDWAMFDTSMDPAPVIEGRITYQARNLPASITLGVDADNYPIISSFAYSRDRLPTDLVFGDTAGGSRTASSLAWTYETGRRRPLSFKFTRQQASTMTGDIDEIGPTAINDLYSWDIASNLTEVEQDVDHADFPSGHKPVQFTPTYDALYRVAKVDFQYEGAGGWSATDAASDWRSTRATHRTADPMRERPAAMLPTIASNRVQTLQYDYDWLANMTSWTDNSSNFYERSIGAITNGGITSGLRPSALYLSTNLPTSAPSYSAGLDRGGWLEVDYGVSGNVVALTVHARCSDQASTNVCYDGGGSLSTRRSNLRSRCVCAGEQHYQYRYDELNRIAEARRYDRAGTGTWNLQVRQRYRYDAGNTRVIKQTIEHTPDPGQRIALYVFPGDYERSGLTRDGTNFEYDASTTLGTETQYLVGGARVTWKTNPMMGSWNLSRNVRVTYAVTDLIQSTAMVFDVWSGKLLETRTHYPNGATETHRAQSSVTMQLEPLSFTTKEADDEVGITYFGQRYLFQHLGRWTTPDPLHVHAVGGGEALNSYHYVSGNLLQARDPEGLCAECRAEAFAGRREAAAREQATSAPPTAIQVGDNLPQTTESAEADAARGRDMALIEGRARSRALAFEAYSQQDPEIFSVLTSERMAQENLTMRDGHFVPDYTRLQARADELLTSNVAVAAYRRQMASNERVEAQVAGTTHIARALSGVEAAARSMGRRSTRAGPPNPYGRRGSPAHTARIAEAETRLTAAGFRTESGGAVDGGLPERGVRVAGGRIRFPDLVMRRGDQRIAIQVGRATRDGRPVARERRALQELRNTGEFDHVFFISYTPDR
jgi:RHS repeat-associated protein